MYGILKKLIIPAYITLLLLAVWGGSFYIFIQYTFFARNLRRLMYVVFVLLGLTIPMAFIAETREVIKTERQRQEKLQQQENLQKEEQSAALRQAAELLSGRIPEEDSAPETQK